jgi:hypothetical protein
MIGTSFDFFACLQRLRLQKFFPEAAALARPRQPRISQG